MLIWIIFRKREPLKFSTNNINTTVVLLFGSIHAIAVIELSEWLLELKKSFKALTLLKIQVAQCYNEKRFYDSIFNTMTDLRIVQIMKGI